MAPQHIKRWYHFCVGDCRGYQYDCFRYRRADDSEIITDCLWYVAFNRTLETLVNGGVPKSLEEIAADIDAEIKGAHEKERYTILMPKNVSATKRWLNSVRGKKNEKY